VTNNNGFWIAWLDLWTPSCTISLNRNQLQQHTFNLLPRTAPFSFSCLSSFTISKLTQRSHVSSLYNFGKNRINITIFNGSSTIVCLFVAAKTYVSHCLAMDVSAVLLWLQTSGVQVSCHNIIMGPAGLGSENDCSGEASSSLPETETSKAPIR
jgi:hypothetical protein